MTNTPQLPPDFTFSQSSLQDFSACMRRFELRYIERLPWPAPLTDQPLLHEQRLQAGANFHRLVQQWLLGVPAETLTLALDDPELAEWWQTFLHHQPLAKLPPHHEVEFTLTGMLAGYRVMAKYDLIAIAPGEKAVIVDWKTTPRRTSPAILANRWQTRLYRWLLVNSGATLNGGQPLRPEQVEMRYWFTADPSNPVIFSYSAEEFDADALALTALLQTAATATEFPLTDDVTHCRFCEYRSLCDRGTHPGTLDELDLLDDPAADLTIALEQISEIAF